MDDRFGELAPLGRQQRLHGGESQGNRAQAPRFHDQRHEPPRRINERVGEAPGGPEVGGGPVRRGEIVLRQLDRGGPRGGPAQCACLRALALEHDAIAAERRSQDLAAGGVDRLFVGGCGQALAERLQRASVLVSEAQLGQLLAQPAGEMPGDQRGDQEGRHCDDVARTADPQASNAAR